MLEQQRQQQRQQNDEKVAAVGDEEKHDESLLISLSATSTPSVHISSSSPAPPQRNQLPEHQVVSEDDTVKNEHDDNYPTEIINEWTSDDEIINNTNTTIIRRSDPDANTNNDDSNNNNVNSFIDITSILHDYCNTNDNLNVQKPFLCNSKTFNLYDAMGATQLMDPKMDCCQIPISAYQTIDCKSSVNANSGNDDSCKKNCNDDDNNNTQVKDKRNNSQDENNNNNCNNDIDNNRMVFPRPIPNGLYDPISSIPWNGDELTIYDASIIVLQILVRLQSLLCGSSPGESTFTCLYCHSSVLADMKDSLDTSNANNKNKKNTDNNQNRQKGQSSSSSSATPVTQSSTTTTQIPTTVTSSQSTSTENNNSSDIARSSVFASALALVDTTEVVRGVILNADIYEEEDFATNTHSIPFYTDKVDINTVLVLQSTIQCIDEYITSRNDSNDDDGSSIDNNGRSNDNYTTAGTNINNNNEDTTTLSTTKQHDECKVDNAGNNSDPLLIVRLALEFQLDFLLACSSLARLSQTDLAKTLKNVQTTVYIAIKKLNNLRATLVNSSNGLYDNKNKRMQLLIQRTFDPYVNRPLVGNLPVRKVMFEQPVVAINILSKITLEFDTIFCTIMLSGKSLRRIHRILDRMNRNSTATSLTMISSSTTPSSATTTTIALNNSNNNINILTRSLLLLNLYFDEKLFGQYSLNQFIMDDIVRCSGKINDNSETQQQDNEGSSFYGMLTSTDHSRAFINRLAKPTYDVLKLRLLNRNRHRAYIEAICLPDWVTLQGEGQVVDTHIRRQNQKLQQQTASVKPKLNNAYLFSQYTLSVTIQLMDRYIESGIEVGLFQSTNNYYHCCDLSFAMWYRAFLLSALSHDFVTRRQQQRQQQEQDKHDNIRHDSYAVDQQQKNATKVTTKGGKKKNNNQNSKNKITPTTSPPVTSNLNTEIIDAERLEDEFEHKFIIIKRNLCRKIVEYIAALQQAYMLKRVEDDSKNRYYQFTSMERIFEKRFEVFQNVHQPPPLTYDNYKEGIDFSTVTQKELLQSASVGFQSIRAELEKLAQELTCHVSSDNGDKSNNIINCIDPLYAAASEDEIKSLIKVCIGNSVYIEKLKQIVTSSSSSSTNDIERKSDVKVSFDFDTHTQFCTIKLTTT